jgi:hypothetical protein
MPYSIDRYDGQNVAVVEDGTINNTLDIKLIGKNYAGYGEAQNENFVWLLENFSNSTPPARPISGQVWYDSGTKRLKFYDGVNFKDTSRTEVDDEKPAGGINTGDFWYNTRRKQLFVFDGDDYRLVGPQDIDGINGSTTMVSMVLNAAPGLTPTPVIVSVVNGEPMSIFSSSSFIVDDITPIVDSDLYANVIIADRLVASDFHARFPRILEGITLRRDSLLIQEGVSAPGLSTDNPILWGTASDAQRLNGIPASEYARRDETTRFIAVARFNDTGFTVGGTEGPPTDYSNDLRISIEDGNVPTIMNQVGNSIVFKTTDSGTRVPLTLVGQNVLPGADNVSDIGSPTLKYKNIHATEFRGLSTHSQRVFASGITANNGFGIGFIEGAVAAVANTIVARDANSDVTARRFIGTATLAERLSVTSGGTTTEFVPADFVRYQDPDFQSNPSTGAVSVVLSTDSAGGIDFGSRLTPSFSIKVASANSLEFRTGNGVNQRIPLILNGANIVPGTTGISNIGSSTFRYSTVFASTFDGMATSLQVNNTTARFATTANTENTIVARDENRVVRATTFEGTATRLNVEGESRVATLTATVSTIAARDAAGDIFANKFRGQATQADTMLLGGSYVEAVVAATANTVAGRDASGNLTANVFNGVATSARYADLAEKYLADQEYPIGTVVCVGGSKEVTACQSGDLAIGTVSENPAYMMNSELEGGTYIALKGRVPVRVVGEVSKGDRLISSSNGTAIALKWSTDPQRDANIVFAVALETNNNTQEKIVEAIVL